MDRVSLSALQLSEIVRENQARVLIGKYGKLLDKKQFQIPPIYRGLRVHVPEQLEPGTINMVYARLEDNPYSNQILNKIHNNHNAPAVNNIPTVLNPIVDLWYGKLSSQYDFLEHHYGVEEHMQFLGLSVKANPRESVLLKFEKDLQGRLIREVTDPEHSSILLGILHTFNTDWKREAKEWIQDYQNVAAYVQLHPTHHLPNEESASNLGFYDIEDVRANNYDSMIHYFRSQEPQSAQEAINNIAHLKQVEEWAKEDGVGLEVKEDIYDMMVQNYIHLQKILPSAVNKAEMAKYCEKFFSSLPPRQ